MAETHTKKEVIPQPHHHVRDLGMIGMVASLLVIILGVLQLIFTDQKQNIFVILFFALLFIMSIGFYAKKDWARKFAIIFLVIFEIAALVAAIILIVFGSLFIPIVLLVILTAIFIIAWKYLQHEHTKNVFEK